MGKLFWVGFVILLAVVVWITPGDPFYEPEVPTLPVYLWLVLQYRADAEPDARFEMQGIFSTKEKAVAACANDNYLVVRFRQDEELPEQTFAEHLPTWYPLSETEPNWVALGGEAPTPRTGAS